jgi:hypothetical protein
MPHKIRHALDDERHCMRSSTSGSYKQTATNKSILKNNKVNSAAQHNQHIQSSQSTTMEPCGIEQVAMAFQALNIIPSASSFCMRTEMRILPLYKAIPGSPDSRF